MIEQPVEFGVKFQRFNMAAGFARCSNTALNTDSMNDTSRIDICYHIMNKLSGRTPLISFIAAKLLQLYNYNIDNSIIQYQYLLTAMGFASAVFCFYTRYPKAKNLIGAAMLMTIMNFTVGLLLNMAIISPESDIQIYYAMSSNMNSFFITAQITLSLLAYSLVVLAFYVDNI